MSAPQAQKKRQDRDLLDRATWLKAASDAVAEGGFGNVRILALAERLGVTRGSFYWHFIDRDDLLHGVLEAWLAWRQKRSAALAPLLREKSGEEAVREWLRIGLAAGRHSTRAIRIELAVRDFAVKNDYAAAVLAQSDRLREEANTLLFRRLVDDEPTARLYGMTTYLMIAGADLILQGPRRDEALVHAIEKLAGDLLLTRLTKP